MKHIINKNISIWIFAGVTVWGLNNGIGAQQTAPSTTPAPPQSGQGLSGINQRAQERMGQEAQQIKERVGQMGQQAQDKAAQLKQQTGAGLSGTMPQGVTATTPTGDQVQQVHKVTQQIVQNALNKGDFLKVADYFTGRDRDRFIHAHLSTDPLDRTIDQFHSQWKSKYNTDFKIADQDQALKTIQPQIGQVTDPQQVVSQWPLGQNVQQGTEANELQGRQIAVLSFPPAQQGSAPVQASFVQNEKNDWKLDIPNVIDAQMLQSNLVKQITACIAMTNSWPRDPNQAYAFVAGQIMQAFYDTSSLTQQGSSSQSGQTGQSSQQSSSSGQQGNQPGAQSSTGGGQGSQSGRGPASSGQQPHQPGQ